MRKTLTTRFVIATTALLIGAAAAFALLQN
jgi:hypothetical protein